jgi:hypothetical protein
MRTVLEQKQVDGGATLVPIGVQLGILKKSQLFSGM